MVPRRFALPPKPRNSFFLWGPRQTGKSTLLHGLYADAHWIDLLDTDSLLRFTHRPAVLREEVEALPPRQLVVIDEVQKMPGLLDEGHWLIENRRPLFVLC